MDRAAMHTNIDNWTHPDGPRHMHEASIPVPLSSVPIGHAALIGIDAWYGPHFDDHPRITVGFYGPRGGARGWATLRAPTESRALHEFMLDAALTGGTERGDCRSIAIDCEWGETLRFVRASRAPFAYLSLHGRSRIPRVRAMLESPDIARVAAAIEFVTTYIEQVPDA